MTSMSPDPLLHATQQLLCTSPEIGTVELSPLKGVIPGAESVDTSWSLARVNGRSFCGREGITLELLSELVFPFGGLGIPRHGFISRYSSVNSRDVGSWWLMTTETFRPVVVACLSPFTSVEPDRSGDERSKALYDEEVAVITCMLRRAWISLFHPGESVGDVPIGLGEPLIAFEVSESVVNRSVRRRCLSPRTWLRSRNLCPLGLQTFHDSCTR